MPAKNLFSKFSLLLTAFLLSMPTTKAQMATQSTSVQEAYYPKIIHAQGEVKIKQEPEPGQPAQWMNAKTGMQIRPGAQIKTTGKSQIDIGLADRYQLRIKEKSDVIAGSLAFNTNTRTLNTQFDLREGSIYNKIHKNYLGEFEINAENVSVTAIGTEYGIDVWGPQKQTWVGMAEGAIHAMDKFSSKPLEIKQGEKIDIGEGEENLLENMPDFELLDLRKELDKIGTGVDEDLDVRVFFILSYSSNRVYEFLENPVLLTNNNEPRKVKQLFIPTVQMLPNRVMNKSLILKNLEKILFVCNYYDDIRFTPHFLSFAGAIYHLLGEDEKAITLFTDVINKYPSFAYVSIIQCAIAIIYDRFLNNPAQAIEAYKKVIANYPESLEKEAAQLRLIQLNQ